MKSVLVNSPAKREVCESHRGAETMASSWTSALGHGAHAPSGGESGPETNHFE
jgi:hypothetical protein